MKKKFMKFKGGTGGTSYGIIIPRTLLEFMGCDLDKMDKTIVDIRLDPSGRKVTISDPEIVEE